MELPQKRFVPFEEILLSFCDSLSKALFVESEHPELVALAFWLRKGQIENLRERFNALKRPGEVVVPRGLAFHIAPANVETLFVYSWILSLLVGNSNVVRLPSRQSTATSLLFTILDKLLRDFPEISESTLLLSYGHEEAVTAAISAESDIRLIWGGDETIATIRKIPQKIAGKELLFADRYSFAAISGEDPVKIAELFFRDLFWYDQMTCASPCTLFWVGTRSNPALYEKMAEISKYQVPLSGRLSKLTEVYRAALDLPVRSVHSFGQLTVIALEQFHPACRQFRGNGLLFEVELKSLRDLIPLVQAKDQTLVHFGFSEKELQDFASSLNGKGIDRIVPIGSALQFQEVWDGYDLLAELTKRVVVQ